MIPGLGAGLALILLAAGLMSAAERRERRREVPSAAQGQVEAIGSVWPDLTLPLLTAGGALVFLLGAGLSLAARRERRINEVVEERTAALRESEKRFMDVLYASEDAILLITDAQFVDCNDATVRMLGYATREEFLMTHPSELSPPTQPDGRRSFEKANEMMKIASEKGFHRFEWVHRKAGGEDFPVEVSLTPIVMKQRNILHCVWRDLTQIKKDERKLRDIFSAVEDYSDGVVLADRDARVHYVNMAFGLRFKYTLEEMQAKGVRGLFAEEAKAEEVLASLLAGVPWNSEVNLVTSAGGTVPTLLRGSPMLDERFAVTGFSFALADLTERKQIESQLLQSQKMQSIGQLAAGIAHEINTPIQFIGDNLQFLENGFAELLGLLGEYRKWRMQAESSGACREPAARLAQAELQADAPYLESEIPKAIGQSREGARRVADIVRAMKEFSHPTQAEKTPVDLNHAIETTATIARNEWKYIADLKLDLDRGLPPVPCLPGDFNQVLLNLIVNAAHAIAEVAEKREGRRGWIAISTRRKERTVEIRVADSGAGIPEAVRPRIFEPFFTTKEVGRGTGQGLAIAYDVVVKKHGGAIRFETESGVGTTFILALPLEGDGA